MPQYIVENDTPRILRDFIKAQVDFIVKEETKKVENQVKEIIEKRIVEMVGRIHVRVQSEMDRRDPSRSQVAVYLELPNPAQHPKKEDKS